MNEDMGKKLLIGGGAIALVSVIWNQIYASGFRDGLIAAGAPPNEWGLNHGGGFPFGLLLLFGIGALIFSKMRQHGRGGPGFGGFGPWRPFFDDRRQGWQPPQGGPFSQATQGGPFAPQGGMGAHFGGAAAHGWPHSQPPQGQPVNPAQPPYAYGQTHTSPPASPAAGTTPETPAPDAWATSQSPANDGQTTPPIV